MSHTGVTDTSPIVREDYTVHDLHLNSRGKKRLVQLTAERVVGDHGSGISSIKSVYSTVNATFIPIFVFIFTTCFDHIGLKHVV
jgi:hypothetical protein